MVDYQILNVSLWLSQRNFSGIIITEFNVALFLNIINLNNCLTLSCSVSMNNFSVGYK